MNSEIYQKQVTVKAEHLDAQQHVNNVVYLQLVQDIAGEHWISKSNDEFNAAYFWVVLDHFIEYKGQAFLGESLTIKTYVQLNEGVKSVRIVEFFKAEKLIVRAKTTWCLINRARNYPSRIPEEVNQMFFEK